MAGEITSPLADRFKARMTRRVAIALVLLALTFVAGKLAITYGRYGEWRWGPSTFPPKLTYHDRHYFRGAGLNSPALTADEVKIGSTDGGTIYGPVNVGTPTVLIVQSKSGTMSYALSGGP